MIEESLSDSSSSSAPENIVARAILDAAFLVHRNVGPGLFESVYESLLAHELMKLGHKVVAQHPIPLIYDDLKFNQGYRADLIVDDLVIVEVKSIEALARVHFKQLLTYLRLADKRLGLLINFNEDLLKDGIRRIANGL